jgi:hypothetical protein
MKLLGLVSVDFDVTDQTFCIHQLFENKRKYSDTVPQVFIDFKKALNPLNAKLNPICHFLALLGAHPILHVSRVRVNSVRSELLNKIFHEFGIVTSCTRRFCPVQFSLYTGENY